MQDALWQRDPYRATHCNLQALREIDARGTSFLRADTRGDWRLLIGSPESAALADAAEESSEEGDPGAPRAVVTPPSLQHGVRDSGRARTSPTSAAFL